MQKEIYLKLTLSPPPPLTKFQKVVRIFGLVIVLFGVYLLRPNQTNPSFAQEEKLHRQIQTQNPIQIDIEKANIHLPVKETVIDEGVWEINPNGASHLDISADPGVAGNVIIYGHNTLNQFGRIVQLKTGDIIEIKTNSNSFTYEVYKTIVVDPKNIATLNESESQTLTLYTCTGFLDSKRFVVKAKRV